MLNFPAAAGPHSTSQFLLQLLARWHNRHSVPLAPPVPPSAAVESVDLPLTKPCFCHGCAAGENPKPVPSTSPLPNFPSSAETIGKITSDISHKQDSWALPSIALTEQCIHFSGSGSLRSVDSFRDNVPFRPSAFRVTVLSRSLLSCE